VGHVATAGLATYGGVLAPPALTRLGNEGIVFDHHRAASTHAGAALTSMLTGEATEHGVTDESMRVSPHAMTLQRMAHEAGVRTAFFSNHALSGPGLGTDAGWDTYAFDSPTDSLDTRVTTGRAIAFLREAGTSRFLLFLHLRGGHPPWDVSPVDAKSLAPAGYSGGLDPAHAAEILSGSGRSGNGGRVSESDRTRAWALYAEAMAKTDAALGTVLAALDTGGQLGSTLVWVTGDVAATESSDLPFGDRTAPIEDALRTVSIALDPREHGARHVTRPTTGSDVARTTLAALGIDWPPDNRGEVLLGPTAEADPGSPRVLFARALDQRAVSWSPFVLTADGKTPARLCARLLDPQCTTDVRATHPLATQALVAASLRPSAHAMPPPEPSAPDAITRAALKRWGL
jgi:arylsulfatase A-like enzyme